MKRVLIYFTLLLIGACANPGWAAGEPEAVKKPGTLVELVSALEAGDAFSDEVASASERARQLGELQDNLKNHEKLFRQILADVPETNLGAASSTQLLDLQRQVLNDSSELEKNIEQLTAGLQSVEALLAKLQTEQAQWVGRLELAKQLQAPGEFMQRLLRVQSDLNGLVQHLRPERDLLLDLLQRATHLRSKTHGLNNELNTRRARLDHELRQSAAEPLWLLFNKPALNAQAVDAERNAQWLSIANYAATHGIRLLLLAVLFFVASYSAMRGLSGGLEGEHPGFKMNATRRVIKHSALSAFLLALLGLMLFSPAAPSAVYDLLWLFVPIPAALLFQAAVGKNIRFTLWALVLSLLTLQFRILLELTPWLDRLVICGQLLLLAAALLFDLRRIHHTALVLHWPRRMIDLAAVAIFLTLAAAFYANLMGHVGLARTLRDGVVGSLGFAVLYFVLFHIVFGLSLVLLRSAAGQLSLMVKKRREALEQLLHSLLRTFAVLGWIIASLAAFAVSDRLPILFKQLMEGNIAVGAAHISSGALVTAALCIFATYIAIRVLRTLLDDEILPRLHIAEGVAYAISMLSRYLVAIIGFLFALSAAGIDLSKMTLLAGAVGVGIGFGLQNIVNNFVSGLILLIEQPIHVGDLVETTSANGVVKHIGIRASTITTSHGADVIVPNGELLARDLMNWTRSSRSRRIDINIGVAYGSDPQQVRQLLVEAIKQHPMVRSFPEPVAFFMNFGESSLDFRLQVWVIDAVDATSISSDLRTSILASLSEQGIDIPFPQRDLWIRETAVTAGLADTKQVPADAK
ncbi:MAG TPA: mechanosensitive ion channel domain-containing protein [Cellvibrio sp.]|nr:mechanosensitive ion channel domain-containing protein [Cellvibrio sp.]